MDRSLLTDISLDDIIEKKRKFSREERTYDRRVEPYARRTSTIRSSSSNSNSGCRVYVGNIPWSSSWQDLKDYMRSVGDVVHATIFTDGNRSRGCGVVEFAHPDDAKRAIEELNDTRLPNTDRQIFVREDREQNTSQYGRSSYSDSHSSHNGRQSSEKFIAFVGNLPFSTTWQDLKDLFRDFGIVLRADVETDRIGRSLGRGTVTFESKASLFDAINELHNSTYRGRELVVREYH